MSLSNASLVANIVLVIVTTYYAILTHKLVRANKRQMDLSAKQTELQLRPYIEVAAGLREGAALFQLRISNTGANTARDLRLTMEPDFYRFHDKDERNHMQKMYPFANVIASFPGKAELVFDLDAAYKFFQGEAGDAIAPPLFTVRAVYSWGERTYDEETTVDLRMFAGASAASVGTLQELKELNSHVEKLVGAVTELSSHRQ